MAEVAEINPRAVPIAAQEPVSFVGMAELSAEGAVAKARETVQFDSVSKGYTVFRDQDVLVAKITPCWENGKVGQAHLDHEVGVGSTEFHVVRATEATDPRYLLHFLRRPEVRARGELRMTGSGGQRRVPAAYLESLQVPLPSLHEQQRIAAILDHADALRAKRRQVLAHLDDLSRSIFHDMFGDPTSDGGVEAARPLAAWVDVDKPITYGILKPGPDIDGGVPYVRVADMKNGDINVEAVRRTTPEIAHAYRRSTIRTGDLLISIRGHVGRFARVPESLDGGNVTQDSARIAINNEASAVYVRGAIETLGLQRWLVRHTKGVAVRGINIGDLRRVPVPDVPLGLQEAFAARVRVVDAQRVAIKNALEADEELFASLQSRAFKDEL